MKKAKRILAGALAALILTMSLPLSALADEADVPVESPSFEVSFDVDTGQEEVSEAPPADIEATPEPTPEPTAEPTQEPTQEPTPTPESTATPAPTAEPTAAPTVTPEVTATPTAVPTSTPEPSAVPSASPVVMPTPTPSPQPVVSPVKLEHDVLDNAETDCIYLFPVPNSSEITQEYSAEHKAIDIAASNGSPVYAAEDGTVSYVQIWDGSYDTTGMMSYGHMVEIRHADGNTTLYAHLSEINVQQGEKVVRGQRIGRVGSTGNATGPHLHFEVITSEGKADPAEYLWTMPGEWIMGYAADTEAGISLTGIGDTGKSVIHFYSLAKETTTTVTGSLGHLPTKAIKSGSTEYPAYCLEKDKRIWGNIDFTWSSFTVPQQTTMKAILAEGFHETNSLDKFDWGNAQGSGLKGNYANETAKWLVTQYLIWAAEKNYITKHSNTSWTWKSQVDTDLETVAKNAYNPTVVRSYYAEVKAKLLNAYTIPSFASSSSSSFSTTIKLYWDGSKYTATVTDSHSVSAYYTYAYNGITFTKNGNKLTISTTKEYPSGVVATASAGDTVEYQIISTLPTITSAATNISAYTFQDVLARGLSYVGGTNSVTLEFFTDEACTNKVTTWKQSDGKFKVTREENNDGTHTMTISMTDDGLAEINTANTAYDNDNGKLYAGYSNYTLRIRYDAKLNSDESLVYGDAGNENEVVLTWKRTNDTYYDTLIDDAHIYTYATNITKTFSDGKEEQTMFDHVLFKAQNATDGYYVIAQLNEDEGIWYVTGHTDKEASATAMHPVEWNGKKGQIILKGVEDDQYIWTELETANGYTLLKNNIDVTITSVDDANRPCDIYSKDTLGVIQNDPRYNFPNNEDYKLANIPQTQLAHNYQTASATVDGNNVTMLDDEMDTGSTNAIAPLQVVNTKGFETPMTGENGTWALAIGGVLVFCLGTSAFIFFLVFKRRKEQEDK